jgi:hypothetical protein
MVVYGSVQVAMNSSVKPRLEPQGQDPSAILIRLNLIDRWSHQTLRCEFCCAKQFANDCNALSANFGLHSSYHWARFTSAIFFVAGNSPPIKYFH